MHPSDLCAGYAPSASRAGGDFSPATWILDFLVSRIFIIIFHTTNNFSDWTKSSVSGSINQLIYRKGIFVAVGEAGLILTSPDGYNWTSRTSGIVTNLNDVY